MLHLAQSNVGHGYRLGDEHLESSSAKRPKGTGDSSSAGAISVSDRQGANHILGCIKHSSEVVVIPLYLVKMQPHFEYCVHFWAP